VALCLQYVLCVGERKEKVVGIRIANERFNSSLLREKCPDRGGHSSGKGGALAICVAKQRPAHRLFVGYVRQQTDGEGLSP
jgi:hypothetical protein